MESLLLSVHIVAGILFVGPVAVAASLFPRFAPVPAAPGAPSPDGDERTARLLHRITRVYGVAALVVPVLGLVLAVVQGRATDVWVIVAMALTAVAGALLALQIAPLQAEVLESGADHLRRLGMLTGLFNVLWVIVVVLMVVRPGAVA
ncbi:membrane protein [Nocardiopsis tropica]